MRQLKTLALRSSATLALLGALSFSAHAQVIIEEDTDEQITTSTAGEDGGPADVDIGGRDDETGEITSTPVVTIDSERSGAVLNSNNDLRLIGTIQAEDIDNVTGVELQGGADRSYTQFGAINLTEDFTPTDTDDDPFTDGGVAIGEGRTGILISGASPFQGNIELTSSASVIIEGNDSFGINLANTPMMTQGLTGNLTSAAVFNITGDRSTAINLASNISGDVTSEGTILVQGEDSQGIVVTGDIDGAFESSSIIQTSGFRTSTRVNFLGEDSDVGREDLTAEDLQLSGSGVNISGNVSNGIFLSDRFEPDLDADGEPILDGNGDPTFTLVGSSEINQFGSAPAVIIDGLGNPIAVGMVAQITDPTLATPQFGFINQGTVAANGVFDDFDATAVSIANVTFTTDPTNLNVSDLGISNTGVLTATAFRAANSTNLAAGGEGIARVLVIGNQAIATQINNTGAIIATVSEATDEVFFDPDNIIPPRSLLAVGVDVEAGGSITELINTGAISAILVGREGTAVAVRDASGSIRSLTNTGAIVATGQNSDPLDNEATEFDLIAIDFSAAIQNVDITQSQNDSVTATPSIIGDILLGSGDDTVTVEAGVVTGDIDFGGGSDTLTLSGNSLFFGSIQNSDNLTLNVTEGTTLALGSDQVVEVADALIDSTSVFQPVLNGNTGDASGLIASNSITFEDGATINPILASIIEPNPQSFTIATAPNLIVGDVSTLNSGISPFLFATELELADPNTLVVTLNLRDPNLSVAEGGLGLDAVQAAAFGGFIDGQFQEGAVFQALANTTELGNAFANITEADEFISAINQVLPEFSGAARQFVVANVDGAVGAVGSHLDTARRSQERTGGAWLEEFFYFADRELAGSSEQYRGNGFGFAAGIDTEVGPFHAVGVNVGFASTEIEDVIGVDDDLNVQTFQLGTYAGFESGGFNVDLYGGGGFNQFDQDRLVSIGDFVGTAQGDWEGVHANATARAGYEVALGEKYWIRPSVSLDYLYLNENGRTETGADGVRLRVDGRNSDTAAATALLDFGAKFQGKRTWIRPSLRVGYRNEFINDPLETAFRFQGLDDGDGNLFDSELARLRAFAFPDEGLLLGFTLAAGSEFSSIGFDLDSDIRDGFIRHTGRIVIRLLF